MKYGEIEQAPLYVTDVDVLDRRISFAAKAITAVVFTGAAAANIAGSSDVFISSGMGAGAGVFGTLAVQEFSKYRRVKRWNSIQDLYFKHQVDQRQP